MRVQHWWIPVLSLLTVVGSGLSSRAQDPFSSAPVPPMGTAPTYATPSGYGGGAGFLPVANGVATPTGPDAVFGPPAVPGPLTASPGISPFDHRFSQDYVSGGLWQRIIRRRPRQLFLTVEALVAELSRPGNALVGAPGAPPYVTPDDQPTLFPAYTLSVFNDPTGSGGIRLATGFFNPDDTGVRAHFFWVAERNRSFRPGDPARQPVDTDDPTSNTTLSNLGGLPIQDFVFRADQNPDGTDFTGITVAFDTEYKLEFTGESLGAGLDIYRMPVIRRGNLMVRPVFGLRYLLIRERFGFLGRDSGFTYGPDKPATPKNFDFDENPVVPDFANTDIESPPFTAFIDNSVRSDLAGPHIGFRFDVGGDALHIWGQSIFGLMANSYRMELRGDNIGEPFGVVDDTTDIGPGGVPFTDSESHTHVSPLFEQTFAADLDVVGIIPVIRKIYLLENAKLRLGLTYVVAGEVARPGDSILYYGGPFVPRIRVDKHHWDLFYWTFGFTSTY